MIVGDAFGALVREQFEGGSPFEIVERDDGYIAVGRFNYLAPRREWVAVERRALRWIRGRVLDVGCGPGRLGAELAARGLEVVGVDVSEGAVAVARERGLVAHELRFEALGDTLGTFDTIAMFGNNFGLFGTAARVPRLLRALRKIVSPGGRVIAASVDLCRTEDPLHLAYHDRNRERGRAPGQLRLRVRHRNLTTPWFNYLFVSPGEMAELAESAGWRVRASITDAGPFHVGVLERL